MELKTLKNSRGNSLVELTVVLGIILILASAILLHISPDISVKRGRDNKRIADLAALESAIIEYRIDNEVLPDLPNVTRTSRTLPSGNAGPYESVTVGWIDADFSPYAQKLPLDPLNDSTYYYSYRHNGKTYELNAVIEHQFKLSQNDGGNNPNRYELGDDLSIL